MTSTAPGSVRHRAAFVGYRRSGDRDLSPGLQAVVDYWFRYHMAKAVIAALLLIVLVTLGVRARKAFPKAGVAVMMLAVFTSAIVMANVQGAVAPFASLLPMLADGPPDAELTGTLAQVRQQLAGSLSAGGRTPPALTVMIGDFYRYHVALAVLAAIVAVVLIGTGMMWWKRWRSFSVVSLSVSLVVIVVGVANTTTAADPAPALLAFFDGAW